MTDRVAELETERDNLALSLALAIETTTAMQAHMHELEAAQKPRPIETAPKDGTRILVEVPNPHVHRPPNWYTGVLAEGYREENSCPDNPTFGWWRDDDSDEVIEPTRWLPRPPVSEVKS